MSESLNRAGINAVLGAGSIVLNDYLLSIDPIERGYRLTVTRGSDLQTMDIMDGVGIVGIEKTGSTGNVDSYRVTFTDGSAFDYTIETNAAAHAAAEAAREEAEAGRVSAEEGRVLAESGRASAEAVRVQAEDVRISAETSRSEAESARAQAEIARQSADTARQNAESARVTAEQGRVTAESARAQAENKRVLAEDNRANAETAREKAEQERASAEAARVEAENVRAGAEGLRESAFEANEAQRQSEFESAEAGRAAAEIERANAETARAETFAGYEARIDACTPDDTTITTKPWTSKKTVDALCQPFESSGGVVQCRPVEGYPLGVKSRVDAVQQGSGDPSPDNVRPIVGWDAIKVNRCGKNMIRRNVNLKETTIKGVNFKPLEDGSIVANGTATGNIYFAISGGINEYIKASKDYFLSGCPKNGSKTSYYFTAYINGKWHPDYGNGARIQFTDTILTGNERIEITITKGYEASNLIFKPMLELGSTATSYEPYTGDTYTAALPETVYGGELDWDTGVLTVDRARRNLTGSENVNAELGWDIGVYKIQGILGDAVKVSGYKTIADLLCSHTGNVLTPDSIANNYGGTNNHSVGQGGETVLFIKISAEYDTVSKFTDYLTTQYAAGTPVQIRYKLADPYTIQLTPQQIAALRGVNTLYSNSGDTSVSGRTDPVWLTQSLMDRIAALESAATEI